MGVKQTSPHSGRWYHKITVEPCVLLEMLAYTLKMVVEQVFFLYKACTVNHGYAHDICINIEHHQDVKKEVQITVSTFHMWNSVAMYGIPIVLSLFLGAWSDRRGRKLPLIFGLVGKLIYVVMVTVNTRVTSWSLEYVVFTATLPGSLLGADVAFVSSYMAYVTDVTTVENRTIRMTIVVAMELIAMPIGTILGSVLYNDTVESFTVVFLACSVLLLVAIIYAAIRLKSQTTDHQMTILELPWYRMPADYFDCSHVVSSMKSLVKSRPDNGRIHLYALITIVSLFALNYEEPAKLFLYTQLTFNWDAHLYSYYKTFNLTMCTIVSLAAVPLLSKLFKIRDTFILMIACLLAILGYLIFVFAQLDWLMYVGATLSVWCTLNYPVSYSMISRIIPSDERGVIFSLLSAVQIIFQLLGGALLTLVYNASIEVLPQAFLWMMMGTLVLSLLAAMFIHISLPGRDIDGSVQDECSNSQIVQNGNVVLSESNSELANVASNIYI